MEGILVATQNSQGQPLAALCEVHAQRFEALAARVDAADRTDVQNNTAMLTFAGMLVIDAFRSGLLHDAPGVRERIAWLESAPGGKHDFSGRMFSLIRSDLRAANLTTPLDPNYLRSRESGDGFVLRPNIGGPCRALASLIRAEANKPDDSDWPTVGDAAKAFACAPAKITKAVDSGKLVHNGKNGRERRIDPASLIKWEVQRANGE